jgi:Tfp pilus assembly PilM family ATPase
MKSIGIDPGDQAVKVVELDGSYKKTRLIRVHVAPAGSPGADGLTRAEVVAAAVRQALDDGMRGESTLGHPCREAVLRTIELPFKGHEAIRKVVKSEIEGEIQSQSVDDMVVDFLEIGAGLTGGTKVLVASVPKAGLRTQLAALTAQKVEPESIDLDTMALWRTAHWLGAFAEPEAGNEAAGRGAGEAQGAGEARPPITAVLDLGARSVKVLLVEGERLVEMRALRLGDAVVADDLARRYGLDPAAAREAAVRALRSGADVRIDAVAELPAVAAAEGAATPAAAKAVEPAAARRQVAVAHADVEAAHTAYLQRLARELTRFLTAAGRGEAVRAVWVTGGACRNPGTAEMIAAVFGCEPRELDVLGHLQHDLEPDTVEQVGSRLATAVGLALGRLGGPEGLELRQEDLVLTRGFERIKFPLALACMLALLALFVHAQRRSTELKLLEYEIGSTFIDKKNPKAMPQFFGMLNSVFATPWFDSPQNFRLEQSKGKDFTYKELVAELVAAPVHRRIQIVRDRLKAVADQKQKESGVYEDVSLESGLAVLVRWAEIVKTVEPQLGRYLVTKITLNMRSPNRQLDFTVAFRGEDFRARRDALQRAIDAEMQKADSPFEPPKGNETTRSEVVFKDAGVSGVAGAYFPITLHIKDLFPAFGPSAAALGSAPPPPQPDRPQVASNATGGGR